MSEATVAQIAQRIREHIHGQWIIGNEEAVQLILVAYLSRGHVLIEGPPGTGKTVIAKVISHILNKEFRRIQFTSDMLPSDIIGGHLFNPASKEFNFIPGPIFTDIVLADEINRTSPRTQSALLEAMEERQVTSEGKQMRLSSDFFVLATQNPLEYEGTFPLPEAQLDRFLFNVHLTHGSQQEDAQVLEKVIAGVLPPRMEDLPRFNLDRGALEVEIQSVKVEESLLRAISQLIGMTREHPRLSMGCSVRAGIALARSARIMALIQERDFVIPDDIKPLIAPSLRHRVRRSPEAQLANESVDDIVSEISQRVQFPV